MKRPPNSHGLINRRKMLGQLQFAGSPGAAGSAGAQITPRCESDARPGRRKDQSRVESAARAVGQDKVKLCQHDAAAAQAFRAAPLTVDPIGEGEMWDSRSQRSAPKPRCAVDPRCWRGGSATIRSLHTRYSSSIPVCWPRMRAQGRNDG